MKSKNTSFSELQELIPFIDHKKTYENAKYLLNFAKKILNSCTYFFVKEIKNIDEINNINFNEIIEKKIDIIGEEEIHKLLDFASDLLNQNEKIYFYLSVIKGYGQLNIINGLNDLDYVINNISRIKRSIIFKMMFSIQSIIEYR